MANDAIKLLVGAHGEHDGADGAHVSVAPTWLTLKYS
jgi:hypothetical protein